MSIGERSSFEYSLVDRIAEGTGGNKDYPGFWLLFQVGLRVGG